MKEIKLFFKVKYHRGNLNELYLCSEKAYKNSNFVDTIIPESETHNAIIGFQYKFNANVSTDLVYKMGLYSVNITGDINEIKIKLDVFINNILKQFDTIVPIIYNEKEWNIVEQLLPLNKLSKPLSLFETTNISKNKKLSTYDTELKNAELMNKVFQLKNEDQTI